MSEANYPREWANARLEDCIQILDSVRVPVNNKERQDRIAGKSDTELYPYYGATGEVGKIDGYLFDEELVALGEDGVPFLDGAKAKAYMITGKTWVNNHAHVLKALEGITTNKFLLNYLNQFDYHGYVNGGTRLKLTQANMRRIPYPLPPLAEQQQIAARLDTLLAQVNTLQTRLDAIPTMLKRFRQSVLAAAVRGRLTEVWRSKHDHEWVTTTLGSIIKAGPQNGIYKPSKLYGSGTKIIRIDGFYDGEMSAWEGIKRVQLEDQEIAKWQLNISDILINRVNSIEYLGKCALVRELPESAVFESNIMRITLDTSRAMPEYVTFFLTSLIGLARLRENAKLAVNQASINQGDVKGCLIELPSLDEQTEIVRRIEQLFVFANQIEKRVEDAQARVKHLTQSILAKAFRGELTAEWREHNPALINGENSAEELLKRIKLFRAEKATKNLKRVPGNRKAKMAKLTLDSVKSRVLGMPQDVFTFDQLRNEVAGDYESLKNILFQLLAEPSPILKQSFDSASKQMVLKRVS